MRITCPNCEAQYEVPDDVIPTEGRDVQCSNCGDTWFQAHLDALDDDLAEISEDLTPAAEDIPAADPDDRFDEDDFADEDDFEDTAPPPDASSQVPEIDPAVANILRQEAELEARMRAADRGDPLESQTDMGLDDLPGDEAARRAREASERMARMRGEPASAVAADQDNGSRRGLLPDIEEINSTLRASSDSENDIPQGWDGDAAASGGGFRRGFFLTVLLVVILVLLYLNAAKIAASVPALASMLESYVGLVDRGRVWLDATLSGYIPK